MSFKLVRANNTSEKNPTNWVRCDKKKQRTHKEHDNNMDRRDVSISIDYYENVTSELKKIGEALDFKIVDLKESEIKICKHMKNIEKYKRNMEVANEEKMRIGEKIRKLMNKMNRLEQTIISLSRTSVMEEGMIERENRNKQAISQSMKCLLTRSDILQRQLSKEMTSTIHHNHLDMRIDDTVMKPPRTQGTEGGYEEKGGGGDEEVMNEEYYSQEEEEEQEYV